jgi:hypothetical protein
MKNKFLYICTRYTYSLVNLKYLFKSQFKKNFTFKKVIMPLILFFYFTKFNFKANSNKVLLKDFKIYIPNENSLKEGEIRELKLGKNIEHSLLIIKQNNQIYVINNQCPHSGIPCYLEGAGKNLLNCPWHKISNSNNFNGSIKYLDTLPIHLEYRKSYVLISPENIFRRNFTIAKRDPKNNLKYIIVGGGPAGLSFAETLRKNGFTGEIVIYSDEPLIPYDRTSISKSLLSNFEKIALKTESFFKEYDIEYIPNTKVIFIDNSKKIIKFENGQFSVNFSFILVLR